MLLVVMLLRKACQRHADYRCDRALQPCSHHADNALDIADIAASNTVTVLRYLTQFSNSIRFAMFDS